MPIRAHIEIEGLRELQADIKRQQGKLPQALGQFHKQIGQYVISKLPPGDPHAVGAGFGSTVRASATKREVLIRAGYPNRPLTKGSEGGILAQWGREEVQPFRSGRPYIVGTIEEHEDEIRQRYLDGIVEVLRPAFYSAE